MSEIIAVVSYQMDRLSETSEGTYRVGATMFPLCKIFAHADELANAAELEHRLRRIRDMNVSSSHFGESVWNVLLIGFMETMKNEE